MWHASIFLYRPMLDAKGRPIVILVDDWGLRERRAMEIGMGYLLGQVGDHGREPIDEVISGRGYHRRIPLTSAEIDLMAEHPEAAWAREEARKLGYLST